MTVCSVSMCTVESAWVFGTSLVKYNFLLQAVVRMGIVKEPFTHVQG